MIPQQKVNISEQRPPKYIQHTNGCEVISNDESIKIELRHITTMDGSMERDYYYSVMWMKEENGWNKVNNVSSYPSIESFIDTLDKVDEFTQAVDDFKLTQKEEQ